MTREEYDQKRKELRAKHEMSLKHLAVEYAKSNNPYNVGDIITDHYQTGRITEIKYYTSEERPECVYICDNLTKKGTIKVNDPVTKIYQSNIVK